MNHGLIVPLAFCLAFSLGGSATQAQRREYRGTVSKILGLIDCGVALQFEMNNIESDYFHILLTNEEGKRAEALICESLKTKRRIVLHLKSPDGNLVESITLE
jgi:hypothetical protein